MADIKHLTTLGDQLFGKRTALLSLWQELAENFYVERADFTGSRNLGSDFASNLSTSYPILARRDLGNAFGSMLRPSSKNWKHIRTQNFDRLGHEAKSWLERSDVLMSRAMYDRHSQFVRATKEGDHDFAAFGQAVIQTSLNKNANGLLYRCWHLRDVAWMEDENGVVTTVFRKWKPTIRDLTQLFKDKCHQKVKDRLEKEPYAEVEAWHIILPADQCGGPKEYRTKWVSIYIDRENDHVMEEVGVKMQEYVIPRWQTVSGSQYAYSPATVAALPDARLIQAMTAVLLEAGEKAVNPPMVAVQEALRSDIAIYAGGVTWADAAYDERMGEILRPLTQDKSGIPLGIDMTRDTRAMIAEAFFLNKIALPQPGNDMTAYEVGQRVQEYIRQALPLFEPMEGEYNGPLCENTFELMLNAGALGPLDSIPQELQGQEFGFLFESPLHDATEREKGQRFMEAKSMLADAAALDPGAVHVIDAKVALRDVLGAIGVPTKWTRSEDEVKKIEDAQIQAQRTQELLANMQAAAEVGKTAAEAGMGAGAQQLGANAMPAGMGV